MLTAKQTHRLERLRNRGTLYELVAVHAESRQTILVGYGGNRSHGRQALRRICEERIDSIRQFAGCQDVRMGKGASATCGEWTISWSGRTQRECIIEGERDFILDLI